MSAFLLICTLNGIVGNGDGGIYFRNANECINFKEILSGQSYMKKDKPQVYECMCKLIPEVDPKKVQVY
tara:strand:- start:1083 stop:1289 length:207 start_codon:yes stop_codon:yes gene_type:complete